MSTLQMLDVFIGIIFIYLLLSFICSAISEVIEGILKKRGADLHRGICELMQATPENQLLEKIYTHPLISGLYRGQYQTNSKKNLPSYIPAGNFSLALLDIILPASTTQASGAAGGKGLVTDNNATAVIDEKPLQLLRTALLNNAGLPAQQGILTLIDAAEGDIHKARANIEQWYNSSMDRVAGWYKRRVQMILLGLGFALAVGMNADTIAIFKSLMNSPTLRNSLVNASAEYAKTSFAEPLVQNPTDRLNTNLLKINELRLPIGWDWEQAVPSGVVLSNARLAIPNTISGWVSKIASWLITGLAVSLGAPFWFDLLNKMMVIRSTVKPREKSREEASEDRQK